MRFLPGDQNDSVANLRRASDGARRPAPRHIATALVTTLSLAASGCATEVIDLAASTTIEATTDTTASLDGASLDQLAEALQREVGLLSRAVFDDDKPAARAHLARIDQAWALAEPMIVARFGELADQINYDLRRVVQLARNAVEKNRPADADKAVSFLRLALASLDDK